VSLATSFFNVFIATISLTPVLFAQAPSISIRVVEGDGALNDIRVRRARPPVVIVEDAGARPIEGATVTFLLPSTGASGSFGDSGLSLSTQTDAKGLATGRGLRPNGLAGPFRIRVTASWKGAVASASVGQTNVGTAAKSNRTRTAAILALVGGAAVGGAIAATHGGKSGAASGVGSAAVSPGGAGAGSGGTTIIGGNPTLGPPQ
jgi:hypothetical protein